MEEEEITLEAVGGSRDSLGGCLSHFAAGQLHDKVKKNNIDKEI